MDHIFREKVYESSERGGSNTREKANTALGFGIAGTVLGGAALLAKGGLGGLLNGGGGSPVTVNYSDSAPNCGCSPFYAFTKECDDILNLTKTAYELKIGTMAAAAQAREVDVNEKFGLYINNRDNIDKVNGRITDELFSLYKYTRDKDDEASAKISALEAQVAVNSAVRPYQDKLIMCEVDKKFAWLKNYFDAKTCKMIEGVTVLPLTPEVTGVYSQPRCGFIYTPAAAAEGAAAGA